MVSFSAFTSIEYQYDTANMAQCQYFCWLNAEIIANRGEMWKYAA